MKEISCNIIEDLLPLYYDNVCSEESRRLLEDHLSGCVQCREMLTTIKSEVEVPLVMDEAATIKGIAKNIDTLLDGKFSCTGWRVGTTKEKNRQLHVLPISFIIE